MALYKKHIWPFIWVISFGGGTIYSTRVTDYSLDKQEIITQYDLMQLPTLSALTGKHTNDPMDFLNRQAQLHLDTRWMLYSPRLSVPLFISLCEKYLTITSLCRKCWKWSGCPPRAALYMTGCLPMSGLKNWKRNTEMCISGHALSSE